MINPLVQHDPIGRLGLFFFVWAWQCTVYDPKDSSSSQEPLMGLSQLLGQDVDEAKP